jgi:RTX calcium-binding nonapeptide repeat (4 copies)
VDVARSCLLALFAVGCLAVPSHSTAAGASQAVVKKGVKAEVKRGTLRITGSSKGNAVTLRLKRRARGILEVDVGRAGRAEFRFRRKAFRRIVVQGGRGSDTLRISSARGSFTGSERTVVNGGRGSDVLTLVGSRGAEALTVAASRRRLRLTSSALSARAAAVRPVTAGSVEHLDVKPGRGADAVTVGDLTRARVADVALELGSVAGGDGRRDTVVASGTAAGDALSAGGGATRVVSGLPWAFGAAHFEADLDRLIVNALGGVDTLALFGSEGADVIDVSGDGEFMHAVVGEAEVDSEDVESLHVTPLRGADTITLGDLGRTDVGQATLDLGTTPGGPADGETDSVDVLGRDAADNIGVSSVRAISVTGLPTFTSIPGADPGDRLAVNGMGGADTIDAAGLVANAAVLTLRGGADADALSGGPGDDRFAWSTGDGADLVEGGGGTDTADVGGGDLPEIFSLAQVGPRAAITTGAVNAGVMDMAGVERARFGPGRGADAVTVPAFLGPELKTVSVETGADGQQDTVTAEGTVIVDTISVTAEGSGASVGGLPVKTTVTTHEPGEDILQISARDEADTINASTLPAGVIGLTHGGGLGPDLLIGSEGRDRFDGGDGDDFALMGAGDDTFVWDPGDDNDTLEGQAGTDRLLFNGNGAAEAFDISANGGRVRFLRNVANVLMDCNDVEVVDLNALGGSDSTVINNMAGTALGQVNLALGAANGEGDAALDNVSLFGTPGDDVVAISGGPGVLSATGLPTGLSVTGAEAANDRLTVNADAGSDTVNASGVALGAMLLTLNGAAGNDTLTGGAGVDTIDGGPDNDVIHGGPGADVLDGGGQVGDQVFED